MARIRSRISDTRVNASRGDNFGKPVGIAPHFYWGVSQKVTLGITHDWGICLGCERIYNDVFWFDSRGTPHSEQLHTIERWTRTNYGTLVNDFTLEDPGVLSRPVNLKFTAKLVAPGTELMEFICTENNQFGLGVGITNPFVKK